MRQVIALAVKDLRVLPRVRTAFFFTLIWPIIVAVMFGIAFSGPSGGSVTGLKVALVDDDASDGSRAFVKRLQDSAQFVVTPMTRADADASVRRGQQAAVLVVKPGFGERSQRMFYGSPREIEVGNDPSRQAEAAMIEGLLMKAAAEDMQKMFTDGAASSAMVDGAIADAGRDPDAPAELRHFLGELKQFVALPRASGSGAGGADGWQPLKVTSAAVVRERVGPANSFEVTFPQGVVWGLIGCVMSFGLSLVSERTRGTFVRLEMSPLSRAQILGGKALACFVAMLFVQIVLYALGYVAFGVRPSSWLMLGLATLCATTAFCGIMMLVATLGKTEQAASGTAWAILMPLSMVGGGMVPQFILPPWMNAAGVVSPMRWTIRAIEGALWRGFSLSEMAVPCVILIAIGGACFALGTRRLAAA